MQIEDIFNNLQNIVLTFNFKLSFTKSDDNIKFSIRHDFISDIALLGSVDVKEQKVFLYFNVRTSSWVYPGERTDLHDVYSCILAAILRIGGLGLSTGIWDEPNEFSRIKEELYSRTLVIAQPFQQAVIVPGEFEELIVNLLISLEATFFIMRNESLIRSNEGGEIYQDFKYDESSKRWAKRIPELLRHNFQKDPVLVYKRITPTWTYYRNYKKGLSFIYNINFCNYLFNYLKPVYDENIQLYSSVSGTIYTHILSNVSTFLSQKELTKIIVILDKLSDKRNMQIVIPIENFAIVISSKFILVYSADCGKKSFEIERDKLRATYL